MELKHSGIKARDSEAVKEQKTVAAIAAAREQMQEWDYGNDMGEVEYIAIATGEKQYMFKKEKFGIKGDCKG